jgi:hypothetical protein
VAIFEPHDKKGAISQALTILRDSINDLLPLLRRDVVVYVEAVVFICGLAIVSALVPALRILLILNCVVVMVCGAFAATRSADRIGRLSVPRGKAIKRYILVFLNVALYVIPPTLLVGFVLTVSAFAIWPQMFVHSSGSQSPIRTFTQLLFAIWFIAINARVGPAPALGILSDRPEPVLRSWRLTKAFWRSSLAVVCGLSILSWLGVLIGSFLPSPINGIVEIVLGIVSVALYGRAYVQLASEMLDASEVNSVEALAP